MTLLSSPLAASPGGAPIDGRYRLVQHLQRSGYSDRYEAYDMGAGETVVLRLIHPHVVGEVERFSRRFFALCARQVQLSGQYSVPLRDFGRTHEGQFFVATAWQPGATLQQLLQVQGTLTVAQREQLSRDIAVSLQEAHARGLVHGALTPDCIHVFDGRARVGGYDDIRLRGAASLTPTQTQYLPFIAPEVIAADPITRHSDLYSLGAVMFQMSEGKAPHRASTAVKSLRAKRRGAPAMPRTSEPWARVIEHCLQSRPEDRPADAATLLAALPTCRPRLSVATPGAALPAAV